MSALILLLSLGTAFASDDACREQLNRQRQHCTRQLIDAQAEYERATELCGDNWEQRCERLTAEEQRKQIGVAVLKCENQLRKTMQTAAEVARDRDIYAGQYSACTKKLDNDWFHEEERKLQALFREATAANAERERHKIFVEHLTPPIRELFSASEFLQTQRAQTLAVLLAATAWFVSWMWPFVVFARVRTRRRKGQCGVCFGSVPLFVVVPCGHASTCGSCTRMLSKCAVCQQGISSSAQLWMSVDSEPMYHSDDEEVAEDEDVIEPEPSPENEE